MYSEEFYETKKEFKKEIIIISIAYFIVMFVMPFILTNAGIATVVPKVSHWDASGSVNLAFMILFSVEFLLGLIVSMIIKNPYFYYGICVCSFLIKLILFIILSVLMHFIHPLSLVLDIELLFYRFAISYNAFNSLFFIPTMLCMATFFGIQIGLLIKNKKKEKELERRLNESSNR